MGDGEGRVEAAERPVSKAAAKTQRLLYHGLKFTLRVEEWDADHVLLSVSVDPPRQDGGELYQAVLRRPS